MAAFVKEDILKGTQGVQDVWGWSELDRMILVGGIENVAFVDKITTAKSTAGISMGDEHPTEKNCVLQKVECAVLGTDVVQLRCFYRRDDEYKGIEVDASIGYVETNKDRNGDDMILTYTYQIDEKIHADGEPLTEEYEDSYGYIANKAVPLLSYRISGTYATSNPDSWAVNYVGKVNSSTWRGKNARTWLCTRVKMVSRGSMHGQTGFDDDTYNIYAVSAEWKYKPQGWDDTQIFIKANGKPVAEPDSNAKKTFEINEETGMSALESAILN
jgi:hypothetical protein